MVIIGQTGSLKKSARHYINPRILLAKQVKEEPKLRFLDANLASCWIDEMQLRIYNCLVPVIAIPVLHNSLMLSSHSRSLYGRAGNLVAKHLNDGPKHLVLLSKMLILNVTSAVHLRAGKRKKRPYS